MTRAGKTYLRIAGNRLRNNDKMGESMIKELLSTGDISEIEEYVHIRPYVVCAAHDICKSLKTMFGIKLQPEYLINYVLFNTSEAKIKQVGKTIKSKIHTRDYNPIISVIFLAITDMHNLWVKYNQIQVGQDLEYKFLPVEYIGVKETQRYIDILGPILNVLGMPSERNFVIATYRFACLRNFAKAKLNKSNFREALPDVIAKYKVINKKTRLIMSDESIQEKIAHNVIQLSYLP